MTQDQINEAVQARIQRNMDRAATKNMRQWAKDKKQADEVRNMPRHKTVR